MFRGVLLVVAVFTVLPRRPVPSDHITLLRVNFPAGGVATAQGRTSPTLSGCRKISGRRLMMIVWTRDGSTHRFGWIQGMFLSVQSNESCAFRDAVSAV